MNERKPSKAKDYEAEMDISELDHDLAEMEYLMSMLED